MEQEKMARQAEEARVQACFMRCRALALAAGIPISAHIEGPYINTRARRRLGSCRKVDGQAAYRIEVSRYLLAGTERQLETVLLHELLHTCPRCMNHGALWHRYAARLGTLYGYDIRATVRYEAWGLPDPGSREAVKYTIVCQTCGQTIYRRRRCPLVEKTGSYRCGKCGGKLELR